MNPTYLAECFCAGKNVYDIDASTWRAAFQHIEKNGGSLKISPEGAHSVWIESGGHIRSKIRDDRLVLSVLRMVLPGFNGPGLILYRGECKFLFEQGLTGFCWSPDIAVAEVFARGLNALESGGVLLKTYAPTEAILAGPNQHSANWLGENEYTCDPSLLIELEVLRHYPKP